MDGELPTASEVIAKTIVSGAYAKGPIFCLEAIYVRLGASTDAIFAEMDMLAQGINEALSRAGVKVKVSLVREVDEFTPCNSDRCKFYVNVDVRS